MPIWIPKDEVWDQQNFGILRKVIVEASYILYGYAYPPALQVAASSDKLHLISRPAKFRILCPINGF